ncbi:MAG: transposase [Acidobacteria bacterium]|nr:transposase [Acidobacteriota bacterium]
MTLPRSQYVQDGQEGVYHCFNRCVRRAFLYGYDPVTQRDFSHRKAWIVERLRYLADIFAIEVCAYAILINHFHSILRTRPDIVATWSDHEVATRWLTLFPRRDKHNPNALPPPEQQISALTACPERIAELRRRLCSLSWFMACLDEFIARKANKEDGVKGRFWESRFKCQALLDEAAIAACMVYVDLNPIRAGIAFTPEESDFTSIQERIRAWHRETMLPGSIPGKSSQSNQVASSSGELQNQENAEVYSNDNPVPCNSSCWLCPIQSDSKRRGILQMTAAQYFDLVDLSGRMLREGKRGAIDPGLAPILWRIGANPQAWPDTISHFGSKFRLAAGLLSNLRSFANRLGKRWVSGVSMAQAAFSASRPQLA